MSDYITRDEFEAAIAALQCVGDSQTIDVTQSPGGQTIRSIQVIGDDADTAASYISVSYDSVAEEFTVNFGLMPFTFVNGTFSTTPSLNYPDIYESGNSSVSAVDYVFDLPLSNGAVNFYLGRDTGDTSIRVFWSSSVVSSTDTTTNIYNRTDARGTLFAQVTFNTDGTWTVNKDATVGEQITCGEIKPSPKLTITTFNSKITITGARNPITGASLSGTINYTAPFDDYIIIGNSNGSSTVAFNSQSNSGSYDSWQDIGRVKINSSNNVEIAQLYDNNATQLVNSLGYTGQVTEGGTTFYFKNGLMYST